MPLPEVDYVAAPKDQSLEALLGETILLFELRFKTFDVDNAGKIMFQQLIRGLSNVGFHQSEEMRAIFDKVDLDKSSTLDFAEFFALVYLWLIDHDTDGIKTFFSHPTNQSVVKSGITAMGTVMMKYDSDKTRKLSKAELEQLFSEQFPVYVSNGAYKEVLDKYFPIKSDEFSLRNFMLLLYGVLSKAPGAKIKGIYLDSSVPKHTTIIAGFEALEADFKAIDTGGNGSIELSEMAAVLNTHVPSNIRVDLLSRLSHHFARIDEDESQCMDFFEFSVLAYNMSLEGSYSDFYRTSTNPTVIKIALNDIYKVVQQGGQGEPATFTPASLRAPLGEVLGAAAAELDTVFDQVAGGKPAVSIVQLFKILYRLVRPAGSFDSARRRTRRAGVNEMPAGTGPAAHPPRIDPVVPAKFKSLKVLGQGGQGKVCLGTYDGCDYKVAGKTFLSPPNQDQVKEVVDEVNFFIKLDHPNCHYMLGAKTTLEGGGIMLLTEVCDNGSLFDMYNAKQIKISTPSAWRLAKECAQGFEYIHSLGYMHRDIKSLNVFVTLSLTCQVADFGMCTNSPKAVGFFGTAQWMAPEVCAHGGWIMNPAPYDKQCDVYSYGILLWEIFHTKIPYADTGLDQMSIARRVHATAGGGFRPTVNPSRCPPAVHQLLARCWAQAPAARPGFTEIIAHLDALRPTIPGA